MTDARHDRHEREAELFAEASDLPEAERAAFLERACAGDAELLARLRRLLEVDGTPTVGIAVPDLAEGGLPETIGAYRVLGLLGKGGMGVVYEAEQESPRRRVALKVLRPGFLSDSVLKRFEHEAQVLGWLSHPGIAQVYESGTADTGAGPQPYFAMELVRGVPLIEYAEEHGLDAAERLALLARVCDAVQHAHQKGVIHRDLKPANVLVDANGLPKVLDFGIARVSGAEFESATLQTSVGELLGTLPYMSPEQVSGDPAEIDTRSDVYALGVLGYQLLAGVLPHDVSRRSLAEAARTIQEEEPTRLGALDRDLRGDVEILVGRAIEKEKERRYASAEELASDIRRFLAHEPIVARAPGTLYQLSRFARRNRVLVGGVAGILVALSIGLVVSWNLYVESEDRGSRLEVALGDATDAKAVAQDALAKESDALAKERAARDEADRLRGEAEDALLELEETQAWYDGFFAASSPAQVGTDVRVVEVLERAAAGVDEAFPDRPLARARLLARIGDTYREVGLPLQGLPFLERAVALYDEVPGAEPNQVLDARLNLAGCLQELDRFDEAIALYDAALREIAALDRPPTSRELGARTAKGQCLTMLSRLDEARVVADDARARAEALAAEDPLEIARCARLQGAIAMQTGRRPQAAALLDEAIGIFETHDPDNFELHNTRYIRAMIASDRSNNARALELMAEARAGLLESAGEEYPGVFACDLAIGVILSRMGRYEESVERWEGALELAERVHGPESQSVGIVLGYWGYDLYQVGDLELGEELLRASIEMLSGPDGGVLDLVTNQAGLAELLHARGENEEALELVRAAIEGRTAVAGPNHPRIGVDRRTEARILDALGDPEGAEAARAEALRIQLGG